MTLETLDAGIEQRQIDRAVRRFVAIGSRRDEFPDEEPIKAIPAEGRGPAPLGLYATVLLVNTRRDGRAWRRYDRQVVPPGPVKLRDAAIPADGAVPQRVVYAASSEPPLRVETATSFTARYQVQWLRTGAHERAMRFQLWAESPAAQATAQRLGIVYNTASEVSSINDLIAEEWEERAGLYLTISYYRRMTQDAGIIDAVPYGVAINAGEIGDSGGLVVR